MKQLRTLGLISLSLLSLSAYAQETSTYKQEFELFRQSEDFSQLIEAFIDTATNEESGIVDAAQRSALLSSLCEIDFILLLPESLPELDAFIARVCTAQEMEVPAVIILNRTLPQGELIAQQFEETGAALVLDKDFLLRSTNTEIETFIHEKITTLKQKTLNTEAK
jgi:MinD superfamily P-loop ATPase